MSKLEPIIKSIIELFKEYSGKEDKKGQLCNSEFKLLLEKELNLDELKGEFNPENIDEIMTGLDKDKDGVLKFREFCGLIAQLTKAYHKAQREKAKK